MLIEYLLMISILPFNAFWKTITRFPDEFCKWIDEVDISVDNWNKYKDIQQREIL